MQTIKIEPNPTEWHCPNVDVLLERLRYLASGEWMNEFDGKCLLVVTTTESKTLNAYIEPLKEVLTKVNSNVIDWTDYMTLVPKHVPGNSNLDAMENILKRRLLCKRIVREHALNTILVLSVRKTIPEVTRFISDISVVINSKGSGFVIRTVHLSHRHRTPKLN